jgi:hypothetical protein
MAASRCTPVLAAAAMAWALVGCDKLIGLGDFQEGCAFDCGVHEAGLPEATVEAAAMPDAGADAEASVDADAADVVDAEATAPDTGLDETGPTAAQLWAHWPMPNPRAFIAPDSSTLLPHPMAYEAGADVTIVRDAVTGLLWERADAPATDFAAAEAHCATFGPGSGWRVPTRIELVSLVDFTHRPTIDTMTFDAGRAATYWTSSVVQKDAAPDVRQHWTVSFDDGLADNASSATYVRCVQGTP